MARSFLLVAVVLWTLSILLPTPAAAQLSYYRLKKAPHFQYASSRAYVYPLPVDSVVAKVYRKQPIRPSEAWLKNGTPYEIAPHSIDSLLHSPQVPCGYYLYAFLSYGHMTVRIHRKAYITHEFADLREVRTLVVRDTSGRPVTDASVVLDKKSIAYDPVREGYPMPFPKKNHRVTIRCGQDLQLLEYYYTPYRGYGGGGNRREKPRNIEVWRGNFIGYLVTNKPKYLPGDTVRYKAYLLDPYTNNPYEAPVSVSFRSTSYYNSGKEVTVQPALNAAGPGVYYNEFILGDSIKVDETYQLTVTGKVRGKMFSISQRFKVEDYLLNEVRMRVTGEARNLYQCGDSVHLYAHAFDANQLPVSDGRLEISVLSSPVNNETPVTRFIPDTLYRYETPVDASGETYLGFPTDSFPPHEMTLRCHVRLIPANAEVKDTSFQLRITNKPYYFQVQQEGNLFTAELIRNKKSVSETGTVKIFRGSVSERQTVRFPFKYEVQEEDRSYYLEKDSAAREALTISSNFSVPRPVVGTEYDADTATFYISNPMQSLLRYVVYEADDFKMTGNCRRDTVLRIRTRKGRSVTLLTHHVLNGTPVNGRYVAARLDKELSIRVDKKDIVFPGQSDTIGIALKDGTGRAVPATNLTVLAFNSQFEHDFVPILENRGLIRPSLHDRPGTLTLHLQYNDIDYTIPVQDASWLPVCRMDTSFFYRDVYLNRDGWACFQYPVEGMGEAQVAIYLRREGNYYLPGIVYIDDEPVYYGFARSYDAEGLSITEGTHSIRIRTDTGNIFLRNFNIRKGQKYLILLNEKTPPFFCSVQKMPDTLTPREADDIATRIQMYQLEPQYYGPATVYQYPLRARLDHNTGPQLVGPLHLSNTISFFQYGNTRIDHEPEVGQLFSFRPQMTRVEKKDVYEVLAGVRPGLSHAWPRPDRVAPPVPPIDQIWPDSLGIPRDTVLFELTDAKEKNFMPQTTVMLDSVMKLNARVRLHYTGKTAVKSWLLRQNGKAGAASATSSVGETRFVPPGTYTLCVILQNNRCQQYNDIVIQKNGLTIIPVTEDSTAPRCTWATLPSWITSVSTIVQEVKQAKPVKKIIHYNPSEFSGPVSEIYGTITDQQGEPLVNASVQVLMEDATAGGAVTDFDGRFSVKPLREGTYTLKVAYTGYKLALVSGIGLWPGMAARVNIKMEEASTALNEVVVKATRYAAPLIQPRDAGSVATISKEQIQLMPTRNVNNMAASTPGVYQVGSSFGLTTGGGRAQNSLYIVDGVQVDGRAINIGGNRAREDEEPTLQSEQGAAFISTFLGNMSAASGLRRNFRDWAIWEPNLWTDKEGKTSFQADYPDNITSWKTYVLAMNPKGYSGRSFTVTKAFKPLAAQLYVPRFLRYGDSVDAITKVMNYTGQPFSVATSFLQGDSLLRSDSFTVHNARSSDYRVVAPGGQGLDTLGTTATFRMQTGTGYMDGEERKIPVLPVGMVEYKGIFGKLMRDTVIYTRPDTQRFNGKTRIYADASLIGVMLREIENIKEYPHGCTEQITTRLLAISYEEEIKRLMGNDSFNNTQTKKLILEKLVKAQNTDGSFGWFRSNNYDSHITNYVLRTLQRLRPDPVTELIQRRGCQYLAAHLDEMTREARLMALVTLSGAGYAVDYRSKLDRLHHEDTLLFDDVHNQLLRARICQQQKIPCDSLLDTLSGQGQRHVHGVSFGVQRYNWYHNDIASTVLAYQVFSADSRYEQLATRITDYLLFRRRDGYYRSTAESGQVLGALLPGLLKAGLKVDTVRPRLYFTGALQRTIDEFPAFLELKDKTPDLMIRKTGGSPVYLSVLYGMLNPRPEPKSDVFRVESYFVQGKDTLQTLKQGEKVQLRVVVTCRMNSDYVHVDIPLPAGCVPVANPGYYRWPENSREQFRDRVSIYCGQLREGTYTFDVPLEVRFKGSFSMNPAKAEMMYFPDQYGCNAVKKIVVR